MRHRHLAFSALDELKILAVNSPSTPSLYALLEDVEMALLSADIKDPEIRALKRVADRSPVQSATDPWADISYQSLYLDEDSDPADRVVVQEPASSEPLVGVMALKSARLRGQPGLVYCGPPGRLASFLRKLPQYEERGVELSENEMVRCLEECLEAEGLKIIYRQEVPR